MQSIGAALPGDVPRARLGDRRTPWLRRVGPLGYAVAGVALLLAGGGTPPSWRYWPLALLAGVIAGTVLLPLQTIVVGGSAARMIRSVLSAPRTLATSGRARVMAVHYLAVAAGEETFYRMGLQSGLLGDALPAVLAVAVAFVVVHQVGRRELVIVNVLELLVFACLLGWAYAVTHSLPLVIGVHALRNIGIVLAREDFA